VDPGPDRNPVAGLLQESDPRAAAIASAAWSLPAKPGMKCASAPSPTKPSFYISERTPNLARSHRRTARWQLPALRNAAQRTADIESDGVYERRLVRAGLCDLVIIVTTSRTEGRSARSLYAASTLKPGRFLNRCSSRSHWAPAGANISQCFAAASDRPPDEQAITE
jgi:hypothetical protein